MKVAGPARWRPSHLTNVHKRPVSTWGAKWRTAVMRRCRSKEPRTPPPVGSGRPGSRCAVPGRVAARGKGRPCLRCTRMVQVPGPTELRAETSPQGRTWGPAVNEAPVPRLWTVMPSASKSAVWAKNSACTSRIRHVIAPSPGAMTRMASQPSCGLSPCVWRWIHHAQPAATASQAMAAVLRWESGTASSRRAGRSLLAVGQFPRQRAGSGGEVPYGFQGRLPEGIGVGALRPTETAGGSVQVTFLGSGTSSAVACQASGSRSKGSGASSAKVRRRVRRHPRSSSPLRPTRP